MANAKTSKKAGKPTKNILIVDDHPIVRQGIQRLLEQEPGMRIHAEAGSAAEALTALRSLKPDAAIIDISLPGTDGLELTKMIRAERPDLPILVLSMHDESLYAERVLRAGANGYLMKQEVAEKIIPAMRKVLNGEIYLSDRAGQRILRDVSGRAGRTDKPSIEKLSDRELEVLRRIGQGQGTRQIAEQLHLSVKTIETYRAHIKEKLNLKNATELIRFAVQWAEK